MCLYMISQRTPVNFNAVSGVTDTELTVCHIIEHSSDWTDII